MNQEQPIIPLIDNDLRYVARVAERIERVARAAGNLAETYEEGIHAPGVCKAYQDRLAVVYMAARDLQKTHADKARDLRAELDRIKNQEPAAK